MTQDLDRDDLKNSSRLEAIQQGETEQDDSEDPSIYEQYGIERSGTVEITDETDWLLQELTRHHKELQYDEIGDGIEELGNALIQPAAIDATDDVDGSISSSVRSKYTWNSDQSKGGVKESDDDLFKWIYDFRLKESDVEGDDILKQNEHVKMLDSIVTGTNALKWQEEAKLHGSVVKGENLLQQSEAIEATGSTLYGEETLHYVDDVRLVDSFVVGRSPMKYSLGEGEGRIELYNSVIMGEEVMTEQRDVTIRDSIIVGDSVLEDGKADLNNTYLIRDDAVEYYESGTIKGYSSHSGAEADEMWEL